MALRVDATAQRQLAELFSRLQLARQQRAGLPQHLLADRLGVTAGAVANWEAGRGSPTMLHLISWSGHLGYRLTIVDPLGSPRLPPPILDGGESWVLHEMRRLAAALWTRRRSRKLSQADIAERIGVERISIQRWESVNVLPRPIGLVVWAGALECAVGLLPGEGPA